MTSRGYVAMAFSFDDSMGDDLVFSCTSNDNPVSIGCTLIEIQPIALLGIMNLLSLLTNYIYNLGKSRVE